MKYKIYKKNCQDRKQNEESSNTKNPKRNPNNYSNLNKLSSNLLPLPFSIIKPAWQSERIHRIGNQDIPE